MVEDEPPEDCTHCAACCFSDSARHARVTGDDHRRLGDDAESLVEWIGNLAFMRLERATEAHHKCIALTIDPDEGQNRYQGIVDLNGSLSEAALGYFEKSEQIPTKLRIFVGQIQVPGGEPQWRAGGIILQRVAGEGGIQAPESDGDADDNDDWRRFGAYLDTVGADELLDPTLASEDLLYRLFNEDGVRVFAPQPIAFQCRCSAGRVENILKSYTAEELADLTTPDGRIEAKCEFCGTVYPFDPAQL